MITFESSKKRIKQVSMVPLINVVFLLLIFFMVAGTVEQFDIVPVELPEADSGQLLDEGHIAILLGKYNELVINDELVMPEDVLSVLQNELALNANRIVTIKADQSLPAIKMIVMMNRVKQAGGVNISIVTQAP